MWLILLLWHFAFCSGSGTEPTMSPEHAFESRGRGRLRRANLKTDLTVFRNHIGGGRISFIIKGLVCLCSMWYSKLTGIFFLLFFFLCAWESGLLEGRHTVSLQDLISGPGIESTPSAMKAWSANQSDCENSWVSGLLMWNKKRYRWNREEVN